MDHATPRRILAPALLALAALAGPALSALEPVKRPPLPAEPKLSDPATLAVDNGRFAFDLYRELAKDRAGGANVFASPHSISTALAMTVAGAEGPTAAELAKVMRWTQTGDALHDAFAALTRRLAPPKADHPSRTYEWTEANRLWLGMAVLPAFNDRLKLSYAADAGVLAKKPDESAALINAWTDANTNHRITRLVSASDLVDAGLVLTNAVYFRGSWVSPFAKSMTTEREFRVEATTGTPPIKVPTMADVRHVPYARTTWGAGGPGVAAVQLAYQGGVSFIAVLPDEGGLAAVEKQLTLDTFESLRTSFKGTLVDLQIPKFKFQTRRSLRAPLNALGMTNAFGDDATFKRMAAEPLKISDVVHVADVELDEKGTEAAAATAVPLRPTAAVPNHEEPPKPVVFHADRPFIVVIRHDATGEVLFVGRVSDPR